LVGSRSGYYNWEPPSNVAGRLGIGYEALRAVNPKIIYANATGYGNEGDESATAACRVVSMSCCTQAAKGLHGDPEGMARILVASICTSDALDLVERGLSHR